MSDPSSETSPRYPDWKAPADDGGMLIWPDPPDVLRHTADNQRRLSADTPARPAPRLQNVPLPEVRRRQRQWVGHADDAQPLFATGHQTELYHPGVWAKNAFIHAAAKKAGGAAYHFAVDTDSPKHLHLRWPKGSKPVTDDPRLFSAEWTGLLDPPTPQYLEETAAELRAAAAGWAFAPAAESFLDSLRRLSLEQPNLAGALTNAIHRLEWEVGLRHHALLMSPVWAAEPYLLFAHHLLADAGPFAAAYNAALADYRAEQGIRTITRPMPDLPVSHDACEAPFWFDSLADGGRRRARLARVRGCWALAEWEGAAAAGGAFVLDPTADGWAAAAALGDWLRRRRLRLAPRALTLTLFFRLLLADQFVHGIGGGRYDQVADRLIERYFALPAPRFSVTTATLYFPEAAGKRRVNLRPLLQEGRRLRHGLLSRDKRETVRQIESLPRRSRERRELYYRMHARLTQESNSPAVQQWERAFVEAERESLAQKVLFDRELFFAIQPVERLTGMLNRYDAAFESV